MSDWADSVDDLIDQPPTPTSETAAAPQSPDAEHERGSSSVSSSYRSYDEHHRSYERGGRGAPRERHYEERPIPDKPPFQARLRNLVYSLTPNDIGDWFICIGKIDADKILDIEVIKKNGRSTGTALIEFSDRDTLVEALKFNDVDVDGRKMEVVVNLPRSERFPPRSFGFDRGDRGDRGFASRGGDRGDRGDRGYPSRGYGRGERDYPPREERDHRGTEQRDKFGGLPPRDDGAARPRMNLQPRSAAASAAAAAAADKAPKADPFGGARPVDTAKVEEEKMSAYLARMSLKEKDKEAAAKPPAADAAAKPKDAKPKDYSAAAAAAAASPAAAAAESSPKPAAKPAAAAGAERDAFTSRGRARGADKRGGGRGAGRAAPPSSSSGDRSWREHEGHTRGRSGRGADKPAAAVRKETKAPTGNKFSHLAEGEA